MKLEIHAWLCVLVVLSESWQIRGVSSTPAPALTSAAPPIHSRTSAPAAWTATAAHQPAGRDDAIGQTTVSPGKTTYTPQEKASMTTSVAATTPWMGTVTAAAGPPSSTPTPKDDEDDAVNVSTSRSAKPPQSVTPTLPEASAATSSLAPGSVPDMPTNQQVPSELNVGDEDLKGPGQRRSSFLDPLLAGLMSVFIVATAIVFVLVLTFFLRFRQRANNPEFQRLQDLPMDDLMEDMPLSRSSY